MVDLAQPFPLGSEGPEALSPWLNQVKASGGILSVNQYCEASRGFFNLFKRMFGKGKQADYSVADRYDAVFHADGTTQMVTQVEFRLRAGG